MTFPSARRLWPLLAAACALLVPNAAQSAPSERDAARFRVESGSEEDGGRFVRLSRRSAGWRLEYRLSFWHGNGGIIVGGAFRRGECRTCDADMLQEPGAALSRAQIDGLLDDYLRDCPLPPTQEARLRRGLDSAWPRFSRLAEEAWAATQAEAQAIADYGAEPGG